MEKNVHNSVLRVLSYFHYFKYPITLGEVHSYAGTSCTEPMIQSALNDLRDEGIVHQIDKFYCLYNNPDWVQRRVVGNKYAEVQLKKARRNARFLANFPFVEAVCISGSLSKDFSLPDGDLDFFIITAPNRLWIARTLMHLFKKFTFLASAQHSFCMNYYLDMERPSIDPKNFFTAIEMATLKPVFVRRGVAEMYEANRDWLKIFLPNKDCNEQDRQYAHNKWLPTRLAEQALDKVGDRLNKYLFEFTRSSWIRKWTRKGYDVERCLQSIKPYVNTPVNYPVNLPERIMDGYERIYDIMLGNAQKKTTLFGVDTIIVGKEK